MTDTILIVDDEQHIIDLARMYLEQAGYVVTSAIEGNSALELILGAHPPTLVVLDLMLPGLDGWEICKRVRAKSDIPIIMLTARSDDIDRIVGLELGADDYLTKPFNPRELVARIRAILRRAERRPSTEKERTITLDNLAIYPERRIVTVDGKPVELRLKEFDLLLTLAENKGMVFSREKLLDVVWGYDFPGETRTVDVHIAHLRHKLKRMRPTIETVWGVGYRLDA
ncbi:MAG: DNA-binding response regulator [Phototrophicales bacterium]|nr:MAG: DNA-binding response regulator [Phototrophicales bacterium]